MRLLYPPISKMNPSMNRSFTGKSSDVNVLIQEQSSAVFTGNAVTKDVHNYVMFMPWIGPSGAGDMGTLVQTLKTFENNLTGGLEDFERQLRPIFSEGDNIPIYVGLPKKDFGIDLSHNWQMANNYNVFNKLKGAGVDFAKEMTEKLPIGLGEDLVDTAIAVTGQYRFTPERNYYSGTNAMSFTFSWVLSPQNKDEASLIKKIIKVFQYYSTTQTRNAQNSNVFGVVPAYWRIRLPNTTSVRNLRFKNGYLPWMVISSVNYQESEEKYFDGFPVAIKLDIGFQQLFNTKSADELFGTSNDLFTEG